MLGPLVLSSRFLLGNLDRLQINMVILAACLAGGVWLTRGRAVAGGALIGFAAAVKVLPIFFLPYFAWKRWWAAFAAALVTGAVASLAPDSRLRTGALRRVRALLARALGRQLARPQGQSERLRDGRPALHPRRDRSGTRRQKRLTASNDPVVAAIVYGPARGRRGRSSSPRDAAGAQPASPAATVELAIVLCVAVLFAPLAWKHYFVFLLLGQFVLWRAAFGDGYDLAAGRAAAARVAARALLRAHDAHRARRRRQDRSRRRSRRCRR